jgi:hypothetical protein
MDFNLALDEISPAELGGIPSLGPAGKSAQIIS